MGRYAKRLRWGGNRQAYGQHLQATQFHRESIASTATVKTGKKSLEPRTQDALNREPQLKQTATQWELAIQIRLIKSHGSSISSSVLIRDLKTNKVILEYWPAICRWSSNQLEVSGRCPTIDAAMKLAKDIRDQTS